MKFSDILLHFISSTLYDIRLHVAAIHIMSTNSVIKTYTSNNKIIIMQCNALQNAPSNQLCYSLAYIEMSKGGRVCTFHMYIFKSVKHYCD